MHTGATEATVSTRPIEPPRPRDAVAIARGRNKPLYGVKAVGSFVPGLTRKAFEKYGFSAASLITDWPAIAGKELAAFTAPERLKWPRAVERGEDDAAPPKGRPGAVLVLRVDGARGLEVQYNARQIIERINAYFGYSAVAELRIVQAPVAGPTAPERRQLPRSALAPSAHDLTGVGDPALRDALARLGAGVRASGR
jgi:hypothetical protein